MSWKTPVSIRSQFLYFLETKIKIHRLQNQKRKRTIARLYWVPKFGIVRSLKAETSRGRWGRKVQEMGAINTSGLRQTGRNEAKAWDRDAKSRDGDVCRPGDPKRQALAACRKKVIQKVVRHRYRHLTTGYNMLHLYHLPTPTLLHQIEYTDHTRNSITLISTLWRSCNFVETVGADGFVYMLGGHV